MIHRIDPENSEEISNRFDELVRLLEEGSDENVKTHLEGFHHSDLADAFGLLPKNLRSRLLDSFKEDLDPDLLFELEDHLRHEITDNLSVQEVAEVITEMDSDEAVQVLEDMDEEDALAMFEEKNPLLAEDPGAHSDLLRFLVQTRDAMARFVGRTCKSSCLPRASQKCQHCHRETPIFEFDVLNVTKCTKCGSLFHKTCWQMLGAKGCPVCLERREQQRSTNQSPR